MQENNQMKSQLRMYLFTLTLLFLSTVGLHAGSRPIILSDGSVCLGDQGQPVPETSDQEYQRPFRLSTVFLERGNNASPEMKGCMPLVAKCQDCEEFKEGVRSVVVQFRDGNLTRNVALHLDGAMVRVNTVDLGFGDWQPHGNANDRRKVKRDGKIQWIFVDGRPFDCRRSFCRITLQDEDSTQVP